jgi:hypothetical protein
VTCVLCRDGWVCEQHPDLPAFHDDCPGPGMPCGNGCNELAPGIDPRKGHKGFAGGLVYCPNLDQRVKLEQAYAGFFACPGCGERVEGLTWR